MPEVSTDGGLVVANDQRAADAGALMLSRGGNAVDAIVATAFALAVTEPFLCGVGGGAWLVGHHGPSGLPFLVNGPISAPADAAADMFVADQDANPIGFYGWPKVVDDENVIGPRSIGVPGAVSALCLAHARLGALGLPAVMEPAIVLAADGHEVDWLASALTTASATELARFESTASVFLPGGLPIRGPVMGPGHWLRQPELARTLERIAGGGADAFYRGPVGEAIAAAIRDEGGLVSRSDMAECQASWTSPAAAKLGENELLGPLHTGFPTMVQMLQLMARSGPEATGEQKVVDWARAMSRAFEDRFALMSSNPSVDTPWRRLMSAEVTADSHADDLQGRTSSPTSAGCTSHVTAVDADGTVVSLTQTVLDLFGSRYLEPSTGVLLNDGMLYFDPRPGRINSIHPGLAGLSAVSPTILRRAGAPIAALGASGGRRIISAVAQTLQGLLNGAPISAALAEPRMHVESGVAWLDPILGEEAAQRLRSLGFETTVVKELPTTFPYARASGIARTGSRGWTGAADASKPAGIATTD